MGAIAPRTTPEKRLSLELETNMNDSLNLSVSI